MRKVLPWLALIVAAWWIATDPAGAALTIRHLLADLGTFAHGL
jgi:hypothetical protein